MKNLLILLLSTLFSLSTFQLFAQITNTLWSASIGHTAIDEGKVVKFDNNGNIILAGRFGNVPDFDLGPGVFNIAEWSTYDFFVAKYSTTGGLIWAKGFTGPSGSQKEIADLVIDANNNIYLTGRFTGTMDFDPSITQDLRTATSSWNMFLLKLDMNGALVWGHDFGSLVSGNEGIALDLDTQGNVFWTGHYGGTIDFDPSANVANHMAPGDRDIFFAKFSTNGSLNWVKTISANASAEKVVAIHINSNNDIFLSGRDGAGNHVDFDPGIGSTTLQDIYGGFPFAKVFLAQYDNAGNFINVKKYGDNTNTIEINDSYLDKNTDNIYLSGFFQNSMDADPSLTNVVTINGDPSTFSAFLLKLDTAGAYIWNYSLLATSRAEGRALSTYQNQEVLWTGEFWGTTDFDNSQANVNAATVGPRDVFALHINSSGNYINHGIIGGNQNDFIGGLAINSSNQAVLTGSYIATADLDPTTSVANYTASGNSDCFFIFMGNCATTYGALNTQACDMFTSPSGNYTYNQSGIYYDTLPNAAGCDSIIQIVLTLGLSINDTIFIENCSAQYSQSGNLFLDTTGLYIDSLVGQFGCDSIVTIDFTQLSSSSNTITISSCYPQLAPSGDFMMDTSGVYTDSLLNYLDCDSILTINFTITPINYTVDVNSDSLWVSFTVPATYKWFNCADNLPINGANGSTFQPNVTGNYSVVVHNGICSDTSDCYPFNSLGTNNLNEIAFAINVFPNPTSSLLNIRLSSPTTIYILTSDGKKIASLSKALEYKFNTENLENGVYIIQSENGGTTKFCKQ